MLAEYSLEGNVAHQMQKSAELGGVVNEHSLQMKDLRQRVARLEEQVMNPISDFDGDEQERLRVNDALIANAMLKEQNRSLRSQLDGVKEALIESNRNLEAVVRVQRGLL